jgi:hypothetical protein
MPKITVWALLVTASLLASTEIEARPAARTDWTVSSPNQAIRVDIAVRPLSTRLPGQQGAWLQYTVRHNGESAVDWSPLGIRFGETDFGPGLRVVSADDFPS